MFGIVNLFKNYKIDSMRIAMMAVVPNCVIYTMSEYQAEAKISALDFFSRRLVEVTYKGENLGWFDVQITEKSKGKVSVLNGYLTEAERAKLAKLQISVRCEVIDGYYDLKGNFKQQRLGKPRLQYCA